MVQVGRDLGLQVIAEGIEQPRQLIALREMGWEFGQGFLVARPMAAPGVEALLTGPGDDGDDGDDQGRQSSVSECETSRVSS